MKTQETKTGNRNNQVQHVLLRSAAVVISFVLISFTVSAQGFLKQLLTNNSFGQMAMMMTEEVESNAAEVPAEASSNTESNAFYFEQATDAPLLLEEWMTNDLYFGSFNELLKPNVEPELKIENWMIDDSHFVGSNQVEKDKELKLESWMVNDEYWGS